MNAAGAREAITQARQGWAPVVASLAGRFGDLDTAEEAAVLDEDGLPEDLQNCLEIEVG